MKSNQNIANGEREMVSNLKRVREALSLSSYYMAEQLGISQPTYFLMEKKGHTTFERSIKIADILGVPAGEIWPLEGDKTPNLDKLLDNSKKLSEFDVALDQVLKIITDLKQSKGSDLEKIRKQAIAKVRELLDILA